ncbi:MAG TPA: DUF1549 domain-containing protein, partial [Gemmataceae bacterium]|nr:DUF1549 domain-containing protein [Gemmataceae bacterium]
MKTTRISWLALVAGLCAAGASTGTAQQLTGEELEFFEGKIRPIFIENCYKCHSSQSEKVKGGLLLDTKAAMLKGGDTGPSLVPGNAERSLLIKAVRYADPNLQMPPKTKLTDQQISDLEAWVKMGAPDPRTGKQGGILKTDADREKAKQHWSFLPLKKPAVPTPKANLKSWIQNPVDAFIFAKLEEKKMMPALPANRWTLIRRAYFDLIGMPPSPQEVEDFLSDDSPDAFAKVVDRLLASPQYGERWARYWLDIARYADTKGGNVNQMREQLFVYSYTYRDYVINAFNDDLPYNQFIMQQVAADQLPQSDSKKALAGLGFLSLSRQGNMQETIDDRIDVVTRGFMGLSVYCARCHDHKFDPIPTADYYSLYGVFASTVEPGDKPIIDAPEQTKEYKEYQQKLAVLEREAENFRQT